MTTARILIVDDEEPVRFVLERSLRREPYLVDTAKNGREALAMLNQEAYDLVFLDLQMEPIGGMEVFTAIREQKRDIVVIILTAHGSLGSSVKALQLGAFDYLFKPADPAIIRQSVRDGLERQRKQQKRQQVIAQINNLQLLLAELDEDGVEVEEERVENGRFLRTTSLIIDQHHQVATLNDTILELTSTEFSILCTLVQHSPNPVSAQELANNSLDYSSTEQEARESIKWHIHKLRRKIEPKPSHPQYIKTVRYKGYFWND